MYNLLFFFCFKILFSHFTIYTTSKKKDQFFLLPSYFFFSCFILFFISAQFCTRNNQMISGKSNSDNDKDDFDLKIIFYASNDITRHIQFIIWSTQLVSSTLESCVLRGIAYPVHILYPTLLSKNFQQFQLFGRLFTNCRS